MIVFINFAPLNFAGGAERWMIDMATRVNRFEEVTLVDVHPSIANIYGQFVLGRKYTSRLSKKNNLKTQRHISLTKYAFIPFSNEWHQMKKTILNSKRVYIRFELLETLILIYFGGFKVFKKTIAGIHSPYIYTFPKSVMDRIHNFVYSSSVIRWVLSKMYRVHVLNKSNEILFTKNFHLKNITYIPNYLEIKNNLLFKQKNKNDSFLNILFIGELNTRKGTDILIKLINESPKNFLFNIAGDGPMKNKIMKLAHTKKAVKYFGYIQGNHLNQIYEDADVLFMPSVAESFSLSCLEAMSFGLPIISSSAINMGLPSYIHQINKKGSIAEYKKILNNMLMLKKNKRLFYQKKKIQQYVKANYSSDIIVPKLLKHVFDMT